MSNDFDGVPDEVVDGLTRPPAQPTPAQEREAERLANKAQEELKRRGK